jgi:SAM-dependent methyltransferase
MDGYGAETYGAGWAEIYDEVHPAPSPDVIDFIVARAAGGPVLELAIGTGRVAIPLTEAGLEVDGVEISAAMVDRLRQRSQAVRLVATDMTDFEVDIEYPLVLLGFNTLFGALEEKGQRGIFMSTARALRRGGVFVIDCFVPDLGRFDRGQTVRVADIQADRVRIDYSIHDASRQLIRSMADFRWTDGRSALLPVYVRYMWPRQIDEMADGAGLDLEQRYEWYDETPFTDASSRHVSVYRKR